MVPTNLWTSDVEAFVFLVGLSPMNVFIPPISPGFTWILLLAFPIFPYDDIRSMSSWEVY